MDPDFRPYERELVSLRPQRLGAGALGGLLAGVLFSIYMNLSGVFELISPQVGPLRAPTTGPTAVVLQWLVPLVMSTIFGLVFGAIADVRTIGAGVVWGLAWGVAIFAFATLVFMTGALDTPSTLRRPVLQSLLGHVGFGALLGALYVVFRERAEAPARAGEGRPTLRRAPP